MALGFGVFDLLEQTFPGNAESLVCRQFRHDVVVVGIKPLGHFAGCRRCAAGGPATGHAEQGVQAYRLVVVLLEAVGYHPQQAGKFKNLVVPGEIAHRHQVQAGIGLQRPVPLTQALAHMFQFGLLQIAGPVGFHGLLQLTAGTNAGEAEVVEGGHGVVLSF